MFYTNNCSLYNSYTVNIKRIHYIEALEMRSVYGKDQLDRPKKYKEVGT